VDRQQIQQVLINLIQNAADSIGQDGNITIRTREIAAPAPVSGDGERAVVLEVVDTGRGIPPELEGRIFDPFFSTKEGGTGLGLSIASRIVEKHGGVIQYATQANRGTTFRLIFPKTLTRS
jgi:signal transduction histidine kinase